MCVLEIAKWPWRPL